MPLTPPADHVDLLERPLLASFATVRADGAPQLNPMWFLWDAEREVFRLTHTKVRSNYRVLQSDKHVALLIVDPDADQRYLSVRGAVTDIQDDPEGDFFKRLQTRYEGHADPVVPDRAVRVILTITPDHFRAQ